MEKFKVFRLKEKMYYSMKESNIDIHKYKNIEKVIKIEDRFMDIKNDLFIIAKMSYHFWTWLYNHLEIKVNDMEVKAVNIIKKKLECKQKF